MNMKASELRIGNWITEFTTAYPNGKNIQLTFISDEDDFENCRAIPLSPEIFEKAGFKKTLILSREDKYWYFLGELAYNESYQGWWFRGVLDIELKYVHQLQNFVFALTNQELTINL